MKENGLMIKLMDMVFIGIKTEHITKENGVKISNMVLD